MSFLDTILSSGPADALLTTGAAVNVSHAPPPAPGMVLTALDAVHAQWQVPTSSSAAASLLTTTGEVDVGGSGAPAPGDVLTAVSPTEAIWQPTSTPSDAVPTDIIPNTPGAPGVDTALSRADHAHPVDVAAPATLEVGGPNITGTSTALACSDHMHELPPFGVTEGTFAEGDDGRLALRFVDLSEVTLEENTWGVMHATGDEGYYDSGLPVGLPAGTRIGFMLGPETSHVGFELPETMQQRNGTFGAGCQLSVGQYAEWTLVDDGALRWHMTAITLGFTTDPIDPAELTSGGTGSGDVGGSTIPARADHRHNVQVSVPSALTVGGVQALGTSPSLVKADHIHAMPGLATGAAHGFMSLSDFTKLAGIAVSAAAVSSTAPTQVVAGAAASAGSQPDAARRDHIHSISTGAPVALSVGGSNAAGSATSLVRSDHTHSLPAFGSGSGTFCQGSDSRLTDDRVASALRTASNTVNVSSAAVPSAGQVLCASGSTAAVWATPAFNPGLNGLRLSHTADDSAGADGTFSTVYLAHASGNTIALFDGISRWFVYAAAGASGAISYAVTGRTAGVPFDVFAYWTGTAVALEVANWTDATTRATAITRTSGVWVKNSDPTRRLLGTVRPRSATTFQMRRLSDWSTAPAGLDIWNVDNRRQSPLTLNGTGANYTYTTATVRQANGLANAQIDTISGLAGADAITVNVRATATGTSTGTSDYCAIAVGQGSGTLTPSSLRGVGTVIAAVGAVGLFAMTCESVPLGIGAYKWLERGSGAGTVTWLGNTPAENQPGMTATVWW